MSRKISVLTAALIAALASAAEAVSLGDLQVKSRPGQPLEAILEILDVDTTISPLLVRVAPPATYVREGVEWPQEAQDLRMARLPGDPERVRLRVTGTQTLVTGFPLLVELNAGGRVTVREYRLVRREDGYGVAAEGERDARTHRQEDVPSGNATPAPATEKVDAPAKSTVAGAATEDSPASRPVMKAVPPEVAPRPEAKAEGAGERPPEEPRPPEAAGSGTDAPTAEKTEERKKEGKEERASGAAEAVAGPVVHAASAEAAQPAPDKPLVRTAEPAKRILTSAELPRHLRSKLRAPTVVREYVALNGFNPSESFPVKHNMTLWSIGQLYWPSYPGALLEQVVVALRDKNPKAFRNGDPSRIIEGSMLESPDSDEVFAIDPLQAFRTIHGRGVAVPAPTQNLIDAQRLSRESAGEVAAAQIVARVKGGSAENEAQAGRDALADWQADHPEAAGGGTAVPVPEREPAADEVVERAESGTPPADVQEPAGSDGPGLLKRIRAFGEASGSGKWLAPGLGVLAVLLAGGILFLRRRKRSGSGQEESREQGIVLQRRIEPSTEAQLKALDATISEAVKNGTTAGAMGAGAMAYAEARQEAERSASGENGAAEAPVPGEGRKDEPAESEAAGGSDEDADADLPPDQPWLSPDDEELPPLDEAERRRNETRTEEDRQKDYRRLQEVLDKVDLDLGKPEAEGTAEPAETAPRKTDEYVPPLSSEPTGRNGDSAGAAPVTPVRPAGMPAAAAAPMDEDRAQQEALDAKLQLANSFIGLGARNEARELLDEVRRKGSERQRENARRLLERLSAEK